MNHKILSVVLSQATQSGTLDESDRTFMAVQLLLDNNNTADALSSLSAVTIGVAGVVCDSLKDNEATKDAVTLKERVEFVIKDLRDAVDKTMNDESGDGEKWVRQIREMYNAGGSDER